LLGAASAFDMALNQCRWIYKCDDDWLTVTCTAADLDPAMTFALEASGAPIAWLICGEIAAGPAEFDGSPSLTIDARRARLTIRPDRKSVLAKHQPAITFHVVTPSPEIVSRVGGDELLFLDHAARRLPYFAIQTRPTTSFTLVFVGELDDDGSADALCAKYESPREAIARPVRSRISFGGT